MKKLLILIGFLLIVSRALAKPSITIHEPKNQTYTTSGIPLNITLNETANITVYLSGKDTHGNDYDENLILNISNVSEYYNILYLLSGNYSLRVNATNENGSSEEVVYFSKLIENEGDVNVTSCGVIASPNTYILVNDIITSEDLCFSVTVDNVTFNCRDHLVDGQEQGNIAFRFLERRFNLFNCKISRWENAGVEGNPSVKSFPIIENVSITNVDIRGVAVWVTGGLIKNVNVSNAGQGIYVASWGNISLTNFELRNLGTGFYFITFNGVVEITNSRIENIEKNIVNGNAKIVNLKIKCSEGQSGKGIFLDSGSRVIIYGTEIYNCHEGIYLGLKTNYNNITSCYIYNNYYGIYSDTQNCNHTIYNNIFNNSYQNIHLPYGPVYFNVSKRRQTNIVGGPFIGGNYWANPSGTGYSEICNDTDKDGICDEPYNVYGNHWDYLPLTAPPPTPYSLMKSVLSLVVIFGTLSYFLRVGEFKDPKDYLAFLMLGVLLIALLAVFLSI